MIISQGMKRPGPANPSISQFSDNWVIRNDVPRLESAPWPISNSLALGDQNDAMLHTKPFIQELGSANHQIKEYEGIS
jgi:hypothetical protein